MGDLITIAGDVHHIFPRAYLKKNGINNRGRYNQVANYTYLDPQVNKAISDNAPNVYFGKIEDQIHIDQDPVIGNIQTEEQLQKNLAMNAIPEDVKTMTVEDYPDFLQQRRKLMAHVVRDYYWSL